MRQLIREILKRTLLYHPLRNYLNKGRQEKERIKWEKSGCPSPPPHIIKQMVLKKYAEEYGLKIFVETGTYLGDMVHSMKNIFNKVYSIEISQKLFEKSKKRFKYQKNIELIHGDSGRMLEYVMRRINEPTLFWLDGHYSGGETKMGDCETPIFEELGHILIQEHAGHVIIIDDSRCFGTDPGYPTKNDLKEYIHGKTKDIDIIELYDFIILTQKDIRERQSTASTFALGSKDTPNSRAKIRNSSITTPAT